MEGMAEIEEQYKEGDDTTKTGDAKNGSPTIVKVEKTNSDRAESESAVAATVTSKVSSTSPSSAALGSTVAASKKGCKKRKEHCPCKVCGLKMADMPAGFPYCYQHKADSEACHAQLLSAHKKDVEDKEQEARLQEFLACRDAAEGPPSKFASWVLKFAQDCPSKGCGQTRKIYDYVAIIYCFSFASGRGPRPHAPPSQGTYLVAKTRMARLL
jgi:hypothetical protein